MKKIIALSIMVWVVSIGLLHAQLPVVTLKTIDGQSVRTDTLSNNGKPFEKESSRARAKQLIHELSAWNPDIRSSLWGAMENIKSDYLPHTVRQSDIVHKS